MNKKIEEILTNFQNEFFIKLYHDKNNKSGFDWFLNCASTDEEYGNRSMEDIMHEMKLFIRNALTDMDESKNIGGKKITKEEFTKLLQQAYDSGYASTTYMKVSDLDKRRKDLEKLSNLL